MRLPVPFLQLPLRFDAERLQAEMLALGNDGWRKHPSNYPGNYSLPLIAVDGEPDNDAVAGPMLPTPHLERCPYLSQVLGRLGAVWGRTRLMKLAGGAEVTPHVDINYYWREHVRVHVPIQTTPAVQFQCGDAQVNMKPGECWIFDTWRPHRVINPTSSERVHLVADTVGGDEFWRIVDRARTPEQQGAAGWLPQDFGAEAAAGSSTPLLLEQFNVPVVMTPWELREHLQFIVPYIKPDPGLRLVQQKASRFAASWHALWARYGDTREGWHSFARLRDEFDAWMEQNAGGLQLTNGMGFVQTLRSMILKAAVTGYDDAAGGAIAARPATEPKGVAEAADTGFDRPIFIVCPPRSGSSLLFETLSLSPDVCTLGDESHRMIEVETADGALGAIARGYVSNRLEATDATPAIAGELRNRYRACVFDREGRGRAGPIRLLEKTPKNALRIPFLSTVFPDAVFVYLYRDPRAVMASMMEAWESGRFRTYPDLPDWTGLPWSLLLVPGWRDLIGKPLPEIVAAQWSTTTRILLDDLEALPAERVRVLRYEALLADPDAAIGGLCRALGLRWDRILGNELPLARYTVTPPHPEKWRRREQEMQLLVPRIAGLQARAVQVLQDRAAA